MTKLVAPCDLMREIARAMGTDSQNLFTDHQEHWQKIQTATASLPTSVQVTLNTFLASNGPSLTDALTLRQQIGQALYQAADLAESVDSGMAQTF